MAMAYDFGCLISRLDENLNHLMSCEDKAFSISNENLYILNQNQSLRECLEAMYTNNYPVCLVHYPNGIPTFRKYASVGTVTKEELTIKGHAAQRAEPPEHLKILKSGSGNEPKSLVALQDAAFELARQHYLILDMRDVLCFVVDKYLEIHRKNETEEMPLTFVNGILVTPVGEIADISGRNNYECVTDKNTLRELLKKLEFSPRIPIISIKKELSSEGANVTESPIHIIGIISVTEVLSLLEQLSPQKGALAVAFEADPMTTFSGKKTITSLDRWTAGQIKSQTQPGKSRRDEGSELHVCFEDESLLQGLLSLHRTGFSAIPIVSHSNPRQCMAVFSTRDLQPFLLKGNELGSLHAPILDFASALHQLESLKARYPVIHVKETATIDAVIGKILASNVKRLFLTDHEGLLSDILTVTDLGRFLARELAGRTK